MKKSAHLVGVPGNSTNSDPDYFDKHGEPVYAHAHMVHAMELNKKKHLMIFNKCQLRESEEASRRPLSYCSAEG